MEPIGNVTGLRVDALVGSHRLLDEKEGERNALQQVAKNGNCSPQAVQVKRDGHKRIFGRSRSLWYTLSVTCDEN